MINIKKDNWPLKMSYEIVPEITNAIPTPKQIGEKRYSWKRFKFPAICVLLALCKQTV